MFLQTALVVIITVVLADERPPYVECQQNSDCDDGYCCVLSSQRFSIPQCVPLRGEGDPCRYRGYAPITTVLSYPNNDTVRVSGIYRDFCPCEPHHVCSKGTSTCKRRTKNITRVNNTEDKIDK